MRASMLLMGNRKSRQHGKHGNRDFHQMPWFFQNAVLCCVLSKMPWFLRFLQERSVFNQHSWSLSYDFNTKIFSLAFATKVRVLCYFL